MYSLIAMVDGDSASKIRLNPSVGTEDVAQNTQPTITIAKVATCTLQILLFALSFAFFLIALFLNVFPPFGMAIPITAVIVFGALLAGECIVGPYCIYRSIFPVTDTRISGNPSANPGEKTTTVICASHTRTQPIIANPSKAKSARFKTGATMAFFCGALCLMAAIVYPLHFIISLIPRLWERREKPAQL
ncbi:MAG: hypothetical protein LBI39_03025 [Puniceicoccales bacterium]|nr:hypothetical protein [Puniceicoccales bacterium]